LTSVSTNITQSLSQVNVATLLRSCEMFNNDFTANLLENMSVK